MVQWLGFCTSTAGGLGWIPSLVGELRPQKLQGMARKEKSGTISLTTDVQACLAPAQHTHMVSLNRQEAKFALLEEALAGKEARSPFYRWEN